MRGTNSRGRGLSRALALRTVFPNRIHCARTHGEATIGPPAMRRAFTSKRSGTPMDSARFKALSARVGAWSIVATIFNRGSKKYRHEAPSQWWKRMRYQKARAVQKTEMLANPDDPLVTPMRRIVDLWISTKNQPKKPGTQRYRTTRIGRLSSFPSKRMFSLSIRSWGRSSGQLVFAAVLPSSVVHAAKRFHRPLTRTGTLKTGQDSPS